MNLIVISLADQRQYEKLTHLTGIVKMSFLPFLDDSRTDENDSNPLRRVNPPPS